LHESPFETTQMPVCAKFPRFTFSQPQKWTNIVIMESHFRLSDCALLLIARHLAKGASTSLPIDAACSDHAVRLHRASDFINTLPRAFSLNPRFSGTAELPAIGDGCGLASRARASIARAFTPQSEQRRVDDPKSDESK
jgi:hypothetical protein